MYRLLLFIVVFSLAGLMALTPSPAAKHIAPDMAVAQLLAELGDTLVVQADTALAGVSAEAGRQIVHTGFASGPDGNRISKQSKHFVCTACHNMEREDPDLTVADPQARLEYARDNGLPFLQGTTLYGAVDRTRFYNGDYEKKYGSLVESARNDLREAIQLCATECSQGRALAPWEMESVVAYLQSIGLKVKDLEFSVQDLEILETARREGKGLEKARQLVRSRFLQGSPATFVAPPEDRRAGYTVDTTSVENGRLVYELSCLHCHENEKYSFFRLDNAQLTFQHLAKHFPKYTQYSTYQVGRYGTSPVPGYKPYMPNYTLEKMSHQQMEDLRAYIEFRAEGQGR